ncbi:Flp family type IVb pilin [Nesterenkonia natronophila]|uniref:Flp family type IVb pilin n=1 Tax=Nesterenkonia natronophila TaxID=2174932 RepID=A0A3A4F330_9MICC|nr:Flp family type IVb pilin [Nesterenkonia natronophila]RJN32463.1 Flp family type IVb pilin [Nesterenkonia natronophila]
MTRAYALVATLQSMVADRVEGRKDRGATAVEYGLLVGLIAVVLIVGVGLFGGALNDYFSSLSDTVSGWNE